MQRCNNLQTTPAASSSSQENHTVACLTSSPSVRSTATQTLSDLGDISVVVNQRGECRNLCVEMSPSRHMHYDNQENASRSVSAHCTEISAQFNATSTMARDDSALKPTFSWAQASNSLLVETKQEQDAPQAKPKTQHSPQDVSVAEGMGSKHERFDVHVQDVLQSVTQQARKQLESTRQAWRSSLSGIIQSDPLASITKISMGVSSSAQKVMKMALSPKRDVLANKSARVRSCRLSPVKGTAATHAYICVCVIFLF